MTKTDETGKLVAYLDGLRRQYIKIARDFDAGRKERTRASHYLQLLEVITANLSKMEAAPIAATRNYSDTTEKLP